MDELKSAESRVPSPFQIIPTDRQMSRVRFSRCGDWIVASGRDGTIRRWETPDWKQATVRLSDPSDTKETKSSPAPIPEPVEWSRMTAHNGWATDLVFHPHQRLVYSCDSWGKIACWDYGAIDATVSWTIDQAHDGWIRQLALSPDGLTLASCGIDHRIRLWSAADGSPQGELDCNGEDVHAIAFHPNGHWLVSGDLKGTVIQWDLKSCSAMTTFDAAVLYRYDRIQDVGGVRVLAFNQDGSKLAIAGTKPETGGFVQGVPTILFLDMTSRELGVTPNLGTSKAGFVHDLVYHREGFWAGVTSGQPGEGQFFLHRDGEEQPFFSTKLPNCHSVAIHPEQTLFAVASNAGKFGQGPSKAKEGEYEGNSSPINLWTLPSL